MDNVDKKLKNLSAGLASTVLRLAKVGVELSSNPSDDNEIKIGASKLGGLPDLPLDLLWPNQREISLSFIAQINLEDLQPFSCKSCLPESGLLYFFYSAEQETWGYDPGDKGSWRVLYTDSTSNLIRTKAPSDLPEYAIFSPCFLAMSEITTYPPINSRHLRSMDLCEQNFNAYSEFLEHEEQERKSLHQLLGHPAAIQDDMQLECQLVTHGLYCGDSTGYESPKAKELEGGASDWHLLLQVDSDDGSGMMWGDCGRLYFWITKDALTNKRFDLVWMILQCS